MTTGGGHGSSLVAWWRRSFRPPPDVPRRGPGRRSRGTILAAALVLVPLALAVAGCNGLRPVEWAELGSQDNPKRQSRQHQDVLRIVPVSNREVARLSPQDVVYIMQRIGFSNDQIVELGTDLHNALLLSGGAQLVYGKQIEMVFGVNNYQVHILSRSRGTFIYDLSMRRFVLGSGSPNGGW